MGTRCHASARTTVLLTQPAFSSATMTSRGDRRRPPAAKLRADDRPRPILLQSDARRRKQRCAAASRRGGWQVHKGRTGRPRQHLEARAAFATPSPRSDEQAFLCEAGSGHLGRVPPAKKALRDQMKLACNPASSRMQPNSESYYSSFDVHLQTRQTRAGSPRLARSSSNPLPMPCCSRAAVEVITQGYKVNKLHVRCKQYYVAIETHGTCTLIIKTVVPA